MRNSIEFKRLCHKRSLALLLGTALASASYVSLVQASGLTEVTLRKAPASKKNNPAADRTTITNSVGSADAVSMNADFSEAPILVTVSLNNQQLSVYKGLDRLHHTRISSGKKGHTTPTGIFSILEKRKYHESNLYSNSPMPYMQRLTWSGIALHQGRVPPFPASHGCVRIPKGTAKTIYGQTRYGSHVILTNDDIAPRPVSHPGLFQPTRHSAVVASLRPVISDINTSVGQSEPGMNGNDKKPPLRILATRTSRKDKTRAMQRMLRSAGYSADKPDGIYGKDTIRAVRTFQHLEGLKVTGTASEETLAKLRQLTQSAALPDGVLYIRQKQKPVYETSFNIKNTKEPLGTHLALISGLSAEKANWIAVSVPTRLKGTTIRDHGIDPVYKRQKVSVSIRSALDRLEIPQDARDFISERLAPGTSFAISDNGLGTETGKGTDFIVQTR